MAVSVPGLTSPGHQPQRQEARPEGGVARADPTHPYPGNRGEQVGLGF